MMNFQTQGHQKGYGRAEQGIPMDGLPLPRPRRTVPGWAWCAFVIAVISAVVVVLTGEPVRREPGSAGQAKDLKTLVEQYKRYELPLPPAKGTTN